MRLLGFLVDRTILDEPGAFDALGAPFWSRPEPGADARAATGCLVLHGTGRINLKTVLFLQDFTDSGFSAAQISCNGDMHEKHTPFP